MASNHRKTVFALDPGATNWRLYRAVYVEQDGRMRLLSDPAPSPLTSFTERRLPSVLLLDPEGEQVLSYGEAARLQAEGDEARRRIKAHFKPSIGAHRLAEPQPHQLRYSHEEALTYTRSLLHEVLEGIRREKWRGAPFDNSFILAVAHPVHWGMDADGEVLRDFQAAIRACLREDSNGELRFVSEPEAAIYSLQRRALLPERSADTSLIIDIGGSTMDLVASQLQGDEPVFHSRYGSPFGGELYDAVIAASIADELGIPEVDQEDDSSIGYTLRGVAKHLKETLSRQLLQQAQVAVVPQRAVTVVSEGGEVYRGSIRLDEERFSALTDHLQRLFEANIDRAMEVMRLRREDVQRVLLVGGGSQLYRVVRDLRQRFGEEKVMIADNPAETVVHGVSLEYGASLAKARPTMFFVTGLDLASFDVEEEEGHAPLWKLTAEDGEDIVLQEGENVIGRSPSSDIQITGEKISRSHACITLTGEGCTLVDLESTNGTFLNGVRLERGEEADLEPGMQLRFGDRVYLLKPL